MPTATFTTIAPTPTATVTPEPCNQVTGGVESRMIVKADGDIDASCDTYILAENITLTAGLNINLMNAVVRNDFGKCGEIEFKAGGEIKIPGATIVDDDCPSNDPDVSEMNGREQLPHTGFNMVVGTPTLDD